MFVDASAIIAIIADEHDAATLTRRLETAQHRYTSPIALYETTLRVVRIRNASIAAVRTVIDDFIARLRIKTIPISTQIGQAAIAAFARFGRGRHPAMSSRGGPVRNIPRDRPAGDWPRTSFAVPETGRAVVALRPATYIPVQCHGTTDQPLPGGSGRCFPGRPVLLLK
jgi:ribonuclease VapC